LVRYAQKHWRAYVPQWLSPSAYNRRSRRRAGVLVHLGPLVAQALGAGTSAYQVVDTVPVPLLRRCRGNTIGSLATPPPSAEGAATTTGTMAANCCWRSPARG
jgi:hypothetical protein